MYSNEPGNCTFACKTGYAYDSKTNSCVLDICQGDLALLNGHMVSGSTQSATKPWVHSTVAGVCAYDCNEGYTWNGSTCAPDPCAPRVITSGDRFKFDIKNAMNSGDELGVTSDAKEIL
jgi:hypothetical protein